MVLIFTPKKYTFFGRKKVIVAIKICNWFIYSFLIKCTYKKKIQESYDEIQPNRKFWEWVKGMWMNQLKV